MLKIVEKLNDGEDTWYEQINEQSFLPETDIPFQHPYYALVVLNGNRVPLPWFFPEIRSFKGLGRTLHNNQKKDLSSMKEQLPPWTTKWVRSWEGNWPAWDNRQI